VSGVRAFEGGIVAEVMEGGLTTDEFLTPYQPAMKTVSEMLAVAMMIETQALISIRDILKRPMT
jgi:hypothetical protein